MLRMIPGNEIKKRKMYEGTTGPGCKNTSV